MGGEMRKAYFGTNMKMYLTAAETVEYVTRLASLTSDINRDCLELFILPPYTAIRAAREAVDPSLIQIGSQSISWENEGQFTGEISPRMVKEAGASFCMIGHSERRNIFRETDDECNARIACALRNDLRVLFCIGETSYDMAHGISDEKLAIQLKLGLNQVPAHILPYIWIAYEPVWAIGSGGKPADPNYVEARHRAIRQTLYNLYGPDGQKVVVFYGGSVNRDNAVALATQPSVDGLFIGRSAWDADNFNHIIRDVMLALEI